MIVIVDYSTGNLRSVENAIYRTGAEAIISADPKIISSADHVILPGVGDASIAMNNLRDKGLDKVILSLNQPVIGICVGMQIMCQWSEEGDAECLGIFETNVTKFKFSEDLNDENLKIPHMGWNTIKHDQSPIFEGINSNEYFYYVHSFAPELCDQTIATTQHGRKFSGALNNRNFYGTQFHPEKSGVNGEILLKNFLKL